MASLILLQTVVSWHLGIHSINLDNDKRYIFWLDDFLSFIFTFYFFYVFFYCYIFYFFILILFFSNFYFLYFCVNFYVVWQVWTLCVLCMWRAGHHWSHFSLTLLEENQLSLCLPHITDWFVICYKYAFVLELIFYRF